MSSTVPLVLLILDGWGYSEQIKHNAIAAAFTPQWDQWWQTRPHILLEASGTPVGLPDKQMGNSEVGHMHIGAGRVIAQDYTRINEAISNGGFAKNQVFVDTILSMKQHGKALHILGLLSPGGVHSHEDHLMALLTLCAEHNFSNVYLHLFLDGRDTPPQSALPSLAKLQKHMLQNPGVTIASISGRYYAMDRDQRWQRIEPVYRLLTEQQSAYSFASAAEAITAFYQQKIEDEFIPPTQIGAGRAIQDGDSVLFFNFRSDRARQLTQAFITQDFQEFKRNKIPNIAHFVSMTSYAADLPTQSAFPPLTCHNTLGEIIAKHGLKQLRLAETEKYAHVTFFFNGGREKAYLNEDRILIPSPSVATYDLQPQMSAAQLTQTLVDVIQRQAYDVIICNYANADMVGHTGNFAAAILAIECIDNALKTIWQALEKIDGQLLITADHGNAELMFDEATHQTHTAHTNEAVPFLYIGKNKKFNCASGSLIDIAPTILSLLGIKPPTEMTGRALLVEDNDHQ